MKCIACGKCCEKHWLVQISGSHEKKVFREQLVCGEYIWTNECKFLKKGKCTVHGTDKQPHRCKEYNCENYPEDN